MIYQDTITLFNRYHSRLGDIWCPHVLHGVNLITDKASMLEKYGADSQDKASLHIKYEGSAYAPLIDGKPYLRPKEWASQVNEQLFDTITFNSDSNYYDFFVRGELSFPDIVTDDDYPNGFYEHIKNRYDDCYVITSVSNPYRVIKHMEILAK